MRPSPGVLASLAAVLAVAALAGCGGSDDDATISADTEVETSTTVIAASSATAAPSPTTEPPTATDPPATDAPATTDPPPPPTEAPVDDGACLVGDWVVTEAQMNAFYAGLMSTLEAPLTIDTVGFAALSFAADGTYGWAPEFTLSVEVAGQAGTGVAGGSITGQWTAVDGVVTTASEVNALEVTVEVNGISFDGNDLANGLLNSSPVNGVTYSCDGPTPVLDFITSDPAVTVPVTLTPA